MIGRVSVAAISICIGACASSGPEINGQAAAAAPATINAVPSGGQNFTRAQPATPEDNFYALETPGVPPAAAVTQASMPDDVICRREVAIGSRFSRRVCRTRAEIEARAKADQELWYQWQR